MQVPLSCPPERANVQEPWHGTMGGYTNHRCRCSECREVWAEYHNARRRHRQELLELGALDITHGRWSGYLNDGCRDNCPGDPDTGMTCRDAWNARAREKYQRRVERQSGVSHGSTVTRSGSVDQPQNDSASDLGIPSIVVEEMP